MAADHLSQEHQRARRVAIRIVHFRYRQPNSYTPTFWSLPGSVSQIGLTNRTS